MNFAGSWEKLLAWLRCYVQRYKIALITVGAVTLLAVALWIVSANTRPWVKIGEQKLIAVSIDLYQTEGYLETQYGDVVPDSVIAAAYADVYRKHGISRIDYDSSILWYALHNPERQIEVYQMIYDSLSARLDAVDTLIAREGRASRVRIMAGQAEIADSVNLLLYPDTVIFVPLGRQLVYHSFERGYVHGTAEEHVFEFNIRLLGAIRKPLPADLQIGIGISSADTLKAFVRRPIRRAGMHKLSIRMPKGDFVPSLKAYLYAPAAATEKLRKHPIPLLVDSVSLIRYSRP